MWTNLFKLFCLFIKHLYYSFQASPNVNLNYSPLCTTEIVANFPFSDNKLRKCLYGLAPKLYINFSLFNWDGVDVIFPYCETL